jgi:hypothetical protein
MKTGPGRKAGAFSFFLPPPAFWINQQKLSINDRWSKPMAAVIEIVLVLVHAVIKAFLG